MNKAGSCWDEGITETACTSWEDDKYDFYVLVNSDAYILSDSTGACPSGKALTEAECEALSGQTVGGLVVNWQSAGTWSLPETCGCYFDTTTETDGKVYFNRLTGACNNPDAGEKIICKGDEDLATGEGSGSSGIESGSMSSESDTSGGSGGGSEYDTSGSGEWGSESRYSGGSGGGGSWGAYYEEPEDDDDDDDRRILQGNDVHLGRLYLSKGYASGDRNGAQ